MGYVLDTTGSFTLNFVLFAVYCILSLAIIWFIFPEKTDSEKSIDSSQARGGSLASAVCRPTMLLFLFKMLCMGALVAVVERLLFLYVQAPPSQVSSGSACAM